MIRLVTPKQVAQAIGVSESSLKRWCDRGVLPFVRTAGGHRRLAVEQVVEYLRASGQTLVRPELIGLPSITGSGPSILRRAHEQLRNALVDSDQALSRRIIVDLYTAGHRVSEICDKVLTPACYDIGDMWKCGDAEVYQERRACELCVRLLAEVRSLVPAAPDRAPVAVGGTTERDPYTLPTLMVEVVLRQLGWQAQSLGTGLPMSTMLAAVRDLRPQIFWLSVSQIENEQAFLAEYRSFYEQVRADVAVVVGGRALSEAIRRQMEYAAHCDNLQHLEAFAAVLKRSFHEPKRRLAAAGPKKRTARRKKGS